MTEPVRIARPMIGADERSAVQHVLESGMIIQGPEVAAFEDEFSALVDDRPCVAVNSGTSALQIALMSLELEAGGQVIVPSFTFAATANAVRLADLEPVFVDIDPTTYCMDPDAAAAAVGPRTVGIMPVHLYGQPAAMRELGDIADRNGLTVVEDAAQAHGATLDGRPVGSWGEAGAFSFYPTKNMTTGEGGMISYLDPSSERVARLLRNQGMERMYENEIVGLNLRMTDIAAAIGRVQLRRLAQFTAIRQANAARLTEALEGSEIIAPTTAPGAVHVYHQYTVRTARRDELEAHLADAGIESRVYYPIPVHHLPAFASEAELVETERASAEVLSLPVGPHLSDAEVERIADALAAFD